MESITEPTFTAVALFLAMALWELTKKLHPKVARVVLRRKEAETRAPAQVLPCVNQTPVLEAIVKQQAQLAQAVVEATHQLDHGRERDAELVKSIDRLASKVERLGDKVVDMGTSVAVLGARVEALLKAAP